MQVPGTLDLCGERLFEPVGREGGHGGVGDHARSVEDATQRRVEIAEHPGQLVPPGYVGRADPNFRAERAQTVQERGIAGLFARAANQHDPTGTVLGEPQRHQLTDRAQAARDEVGRVGVEPGRALRQGRQGVRDQAGDQAGAGPQRDLVVGAVPEQLGQECGRRLVGRVVVQVDQRTPVPGVLERHRPPEAPQRRRARIRVDVPGRLRRPGHHPDPGRRRDFEPDRGLYQRQRRAERWEGRAVQRPEMHDPPLRRRALGQHGVEQRGVVVHAGRIDAARAVLEPARPHLRPRPDHDDRVAAPPERLGERVAQPVVVRQDQPADRSRVRRSLKGAGRRQLPDDVVHPSAEVLDLAPPEHGLTRRPAVADARDLGEEPASRVVEPHVADDRVGRVGTYPIVAPALALGRVVVTNLVEPDGHEDSTLGRVAFKTGVCDVEQRIRKRGIQEVTGELGRIQVRQVQTAQDFAGPVPEVPDPVEAWAELTSHAPAELVVRLAVRLAGAAGADRVGVELQRRVGTGRAGEDPAVGIQPQLVG